jgi:NSS family neurotransmitter:Na+ symporter
VFVTLPDLFARMPGGELFGMAFFFLLIFAAWSSAISLLEVVTASVIDELKLPRRKAALYTGLLITALGIVPAISTDLLGLMDKIAGELLLVAGAVATAIFAGWVVRSDVEAELVKGASPFWARQVPRIMTVLRYAVPPVVAIVLFFSLRETVIMLRGALGG